MRNVTLKDVYVGSVLYVITRKGTVWSFENLSFSKPRILTLKMYDDFYVTLKGGSPRGSAHKKALHYFSLIYWFTPPALGSFMF